MLRRALPLVLVASLVLAAPAAAGRTYKTTLSMSSKFPAFHGRLSSPYTYCEQNRKLKLYRQRMGADKLLGTALSESDGYWEIPIGNRLIGGSYYATVSARTNAVVGVTCRSARSPLRFVD
ncbi:MAG TPA: hypothetical protein VK889_01125 [Solirubrobacterales bacterium]|nr:hypothetical protein [Solirubrobacterales bacterium]